MNSWIWIFPHIQIKISTKPWHATQYPVTAWQYLPRLGMLFLNSCMNSYLRILWRDTSWYTLSHMFFSWIDMTSWFSIHLYMNSDMNFCQDTFWCTRIHSFSWIHARYHGFWPLFMGEIILEIMSEEYREKCREKYSELMEDLWIHEAVRRRAVSDGATGRPFCRRCSRAICLTVSRSTRLFGRATVPIPATLVLSHTQFLLPACLASH